MEAQLNDTIGGLTNVIIDLLDPMYGQCCLDNTIRGLSQLLVVTRLTQLPFISISIDNNRVSLDKRSRIFPNVQIITYTIDLFIPMTMPTCNMQIMTHVNASLMNGTHIT